MVSAAVPQVKLHTIKYFSLMLCPYYFFTPPIEREKSWENSPFENIVCLSNYAIPQTSSEKRVQASDPEDLFLWQHLLLTTSSNICMLNWVTLTYAVSGNGLALSTCTRETIHLNALKERPTGSTSDGKDGEECVSISNLSYEGYKTDSRNTHWGCSEHSTSQKEASKASRRGNRPIKSQKTQRSWGPAKPKDLTKSRLN